MLILLKTTSISTKKNHKVLIKEYKNEFTTKRANKLLLAKIGVEKSILEDNYIKKGEQLRSPLCCFKK